MKYFGEIVGRLPHNRLPDPLLLLAILHETLVENFMIVGSSIIMLRAPHAYYLPKALTCVLLLQSYVATCSSPLCSESYGDQSLDLE